MYGRQEVGRYVLYAMAVTGPETLDSTATEGDPDEFEEGAVGGKSFPSDTFT